jgi:hypothetical protein
VQSIKTGQPACDLDTATLVETLRSKGAVSATVEAAEQDYAVVIQNAEL